MEEVKLTDCKIMSPRSKINSSTKLMGERQEVEFSHCKTRKMNGGREWVIGWKWAWLRSKNKWKEMESERERSKLRWMVFL